MKRFRMSEWLLVAILLIALVVAFIPQQLTVMLEKASMLTLYAIMGYWFDRRAFPAARPDSCQLTPMERAAAGLRRSLLVGAFVVAGSLGA